MIKRFWLNILEAGYLVIEVRNDSIVAVIILSLVSAVLDNLQRDH